MNGLRLAKPKADDKITSIAELKAKVEEIAYQFGGPHLCDDNAGVHRTLEKINEFEASVKGIDDEELQHLEKRELLRRILGEAGEAKKCGGCNLGEGTVKVANPETGEVEWLCEECARGKLP